MLKFGIAMLSLATVASAATAYINQVGYRPGDSRNLP